MLTPKQEAYCLARTRGLSQRQAYREAYPRSVGWKDATVDKRASELESNGEVLGRLKQLRDDAAADAKVTRTEMIDLLADLARDAADRANGETDPLDHARAANVAARAAGTLMQYLPDDRPEDDGKPFVADFGLLVGPSFLEPHRIIERREVSEIWEGGGRGSGKSSHAGLETVNHIERHPDQHGVVFQKHKVNLRDGAYAQIVWAINALGLEDEYDMPDSTLRIIKKSTGQLILFRGVDNARKLKSIKVPFGYIGIAWYEEADMFNGMTEIRMVNQSVTRGGGNALRLYTFNPPRSKTCWINEHVQSLPPGSRYFGSTYLDVPAEWLGPQFIADAEELRRADPQAYEHEYLGIPVGTGGDVFDRYVLREVTDEETAGFDNLRCGQDFGWYPDPWAFTISEWQPAKRRLVTWYEDGGNKLQPNEQAERIMTALTWPDAIDTPPQYHHLPVLSDDADPQAIASQRDTGANARAAGKGGMRQASYRFLQSVEWVIDPVRCPNLAREVREMQYEQNAAGEWMSSIPDGNDHWVDSVRYAMMSIARSRYAYKRQKSDDARETE